MAVPLWPKGGVKKKTIQLYNPNPGSIETDVRAEFSKLLDGDDVVPQRGHWVLLRRMDKTQRCTCWGREAAGTDRYMDDSRKYDEPEEDCPICNGEGWIYDDELHLVRRRIVAPPIGLAGQEQQTEVGIMNVPYLVFYFKYYVNPKKEDKVIEIENNDDGEPVRPFSRKEIYNISIAEPFRDKKGRVEFWRVSVKMEVI